MSILKESLMSTSRSGPQQVVDVAVPLEVLQSGRPFCPPSHPAALFPHGDGQGNYKQRERHDLTYSFPF